jgi:hypothetical protein
VPQTFLAALVEGVQTGRDPGVSTVDQNAIGTLDLANGGARELRQLKCSDARRERLGGERRAQVMKNGRASHDARKNDAPPNLIVATQGLIHPAHGHTLLVTGVNEKQVVRPCVLFLLLFSLSRSLSLARARARK